MPRGHDAGCEGCSLSRSDAAGRGPTWRKKARTHFKIAWLQLVTSNFAGGLPCCQQGKCSASISQCGSMLGSAHRSGSTDRPRGSSPVGTGCTGLNEGVVRIFRDKRAGQAHKEAMRSAARFSARDTASEGALFELGRYNNGEGIEIGDGDIAVHAARIGANRPWRWTHIRGLGAA